MGAPSRLDRGAGITAASSAVHHSALTVAAVWLTPFASRLSYFAHRFRGHTVTWMMPPAIPPVCPGDIVCHECGQVLWCRARDPWCRSTTGAVPDHLEKREGGRQATLLESLQQVLRLAETCPAGPAGDAIRRAACELIEADSFNARTRCRRRMLRCVVRVQGRSRPRTDDPAQLLLRQLADALRRDRWSP